MSKKIYFALIFSLIFLAGSDVASAHSWNGYHWARTTNPFTLKLGDNVTGSWDAVLNTASYDWSLSSVLDTTVVPGLSNKSCRPTMGRVEVCNSKYGNNGWLGIAQVWITDSTHITQGIVKLNDTYFATKRYNTVEWKNLVTCQEIGHTLGLDHQDEDFANSNLGTCMDYTDFPQSNQHPNAADYALLEEIYAHVDTYNSALSTASANIKSVVAADKADEHADFGSVIERNSKGKPSVYEKKLSKGEKVLTHIYWAE